MAVLGALLVARLRWVSVAAGLALALAPQVRADDHTLETAVKATYLYKLAPFVTWPAGALPPRAPFAICVVGMDPFGPVLDRAVAGQSIGDHPILLRRVSRVDASAACPLMYLGGSHGQSVKDALKVLHGLPVLTVTDGAAAPGIVDFAVVGGRVRLRIDEQAAADGGLTISSKLLGLALSVRARNPGTTP